MVERNKILENMVEFHEWAHAFGAETEIDPPEDTLLSVKSKAKAVRSL